MAGILDLEANLSDSEDDCDYVPSRGEVSDDSEFEDEQEEESEATGKPTKKCPRKKLELVEDDKSPEVPMLAKEEEKKRTESLWKNFLDDVGTSSVKKVKPATPVVKAGEETMPIKDASPPKKVTITEVFDFAGEAVIVTKDVDSNSKQLESQKMPKSPNMSDSVKPVAPQKRKGGLSSILGSIMDKKPKMTTLQKSLHDWKNFKKEEGIEEDLERFNKGKGGYIEKQAFLQRSDLRQFEQEKNARLSRRKPKIG